MGEAAALASAFIWACTSSMAGSQARRISPFMVSTIQLVGSSVLLVLAAAILYAGGWIEGVSLGRGLALGAAGIIGPGIGDTLYIAGVRVAGVARAFPISMATFPLFTFVLAALLIGETITLPVVAGAILIVAGSGLIALRGRAVVPDAIVARAGLIAGLSARNTGLLFILGAALFWALNGIWVRVAAEGVAPVLVGAVRMPVALLFTATLARRTGLSLWPGRYRPRSLTILLVAGTLGTGVGSLLWVVGIQHAGAARTAILSSTAPLFALPLAALFLRERITSRIISGTLLSIAGIWLVSI